MARTKKGCIICFEGIDGSGKRTQAELLAKYLSKSGIGSSSYSYPDYGSEYGKIIRRYLDGNSNLGRKEHFLLFLANILKDKELIRRSMGNGEVVVMDRYFYTALAYICPSGLDYLDAKMIVEGIGFEPSFIVFYLDMPASLTKHRKLKQKGKTDRFERDQGFLDEVQGFYEKMIAEKYGAKKWVRIDASQPIEAVHADVLNAPERIL